MKTFSEFQEDMSKLPKLPGLGGGGGGTDSITGKSSAKSLKKRVIDAGKMATVPARFLLNIKSKPDPTEKFADSYKTPKEKVSSAIRDYKKQKKVNEGVASLAVKKGSKVVPALMTGIGAAGTIMRSQKEDDEDAEKLFSEVEKMLKKKNPSTGNRSRAERRIAELKDKLRRNADKRRMEKSFKKPASDKDKLDEGVAALAVKGGSKLIPALMTGIGAAGTILQARRVKKKRKIGAMEKRLMGREQGDRSNDMIVARRGEADKQNKLIDKYEKKYTSQQQKNTRRNIIRGLKSGNIQDEFSAPTNSMGGGAIAGSVEAGDNPPVNKRKKKGEPTIMARGLLPGARTRFKTGADLFTRIKKNKYS